MKNALKKLCLAAVATISFSSFATEDVKLEQLKFGTGSKIGSYHQMAKDIVDFCGPDLKEKANTEIVLVPDTGSVQNIMMMKSKEIDMGLSQQDTYQFFKKRDNYINDRYYKAIFAMHSEPFHLMIPLNWQPNTVKSKKSSGFLWFSDSDEKQERVNILDINNLRNQRVGAWGGSVTSLRQLSDSLNLNLIVETTTLEDVMRGRYNNPVLIVSGQPSSTVQGILKSNQWLIAPLQSKSIAKNNPLYVESNLVYKVLGKVRSVPSVSVRALLMAKASRRASRNKPFEVLASCINDNLIDLEDDRSTSRNWTEVIDFNEKEMFPDVSYFDMK